MVDINKIIDEELREMALQYSSIQIRDIVFTIKKVVKRLEEEKVKQ